MTTTTAKGARVYELLVPFSIPGAGDEPALEISRITLAPPTLATTMKWQAGEYDHPDGMVYALIEELSGLKLATFGQLRYPDADLFMAEVMQHLPPAIRESIASGEYPAPASKAAYATATARAPVDDMAAVMAQAAAPGQPEPIYEDHSYAAMPLTDEERGSIPDPTAGYGMDLGDGGRN